MEELTSFRQFANREAAVQLKHILIQKGIQASLSDEDDSFQQTYFGNGAKHFHEVQISSRDFEKAESILAEADAAEIDAVDSDYYLFEYADKELFEILEKYDEWSHFDYLLAQKILKQRGKEVNAQTLSSLKYKRLDVLARAENVSIYLLASAYLSAILGGIFGIVFGYSIMKSTKTLPDGNKVYSYTPKDRAHGKTIFQIGIIFAAITIIAAIIRGYTMYN